MTSLRKGPAATRPPKVSTAPSASVEEVKSTKPEYQDIDVQKFVDDPEFQKEYYASGKLKRIYKKAPYVASINKGKETKGEFVPHELKFSKEGKLQKEIKRSTYTKASTQTSDTYGVYEPTIREWDPKGYLSSIKSYGAYSRTSKSGKTTTGGVKFEGRQAFEGGTEVYSKDIIRDEQGRAPTSKYYGLTTAEAQELTKQEKAAKVQQKEEKVILLSGRDKKLKNTIESLSPREQRAAETFKKLGYDIDIRGQELRAIRGEEEVVLSPGISVIAKGRQTGKLEATRGFEKKIGIPITKESKKPTLVGEPIKETAFERRVRESKEREQDFYQSEGFQRIQKTAGRLTFGMGVPYEDRSFAGQVAESTLTGFMSFPIAAGGYIPSTFEKLMLTGEGLTIPEARKNIPGMLSEAGKETAKIYDPRTPEGVSTYLTAAVIALPSAVAAVKAGKPIIKLKPSKKLATRTKILEQFKGAKTAGEREAAAQAFLKKGGKQRTLKKAGLEVGEAVEASAPIRVYGTPEQAAQTRQLILSSKMKAFRASDIVTSTISKPVTTAKIAGFRIGRELKDIVKVEVRGPPKITERIRSPIVIRDAGQTVPVAKLKGGLGFEIRSYEPPTKKIGKFIQVRDAGKSVPVAKLKGGLGFEIRSYEDPSSYLTKKVKPFEIKVRDTGKAVPVAQLKRGVEFEIRSYGEPTKKIGKPISIRDYYPPTLEGQVQKNIIEQFGKPKLEKVKPIRIRGDPIIYPTKEIKIKIPQKIAEIPKKIKLAKIGLETEALVKYYKAKRTLFPSRKITTFEPVYKSSLVELRGKKVTRQPIKAKPVDIGVRELKISPLTETEKEITVAKYFGFDSREQFLKARTLAKVRRGPISPDIFKPTKVKTKTKAVTLKPKEVEVTSGGEGSTTKQILQEQETVQVSLTSQKSKTKLTQKPKTRSLADVMAPPQFLSLRQQALGQQQTVSKTLSQTSSPRIDQKYLQDQLSKQSNKLKQEQEQLQKQVQSQTQIQSQVQAQVLSQSPLQGQVLSQGLVQSQLSKQASRQLQKQIQEEIPKFKFKIPPPFPDLDRKKKKKKPKKTKLIPIVRIKSSYTPTLVGLEFLPKVEATPELAQRVYTGLGPRPQVKAPRSKKKKTKPKRRR